MKLWIDTARLGAAEALFGISALERLRRSVRKLPGLQAVELSGAGHVVWPDAQIVASGAALGERLQAALRSSAQPLVVLDGAHLTDPRLIAWLGLQNHSCVAARGDGAQRAVALCLQPDAADAVPAEARTLDEIAGALLAAGAASAVDDAAFPAYIDKLRRALPYWIYRVEDPASRRRLERQLFWDNYKGSTDLLTRYVFPPLVWPLTRFCARFGIHPNTVTVLSIVLAFAAVPLWMNGAWLAGFVCAYAMAVLDSVDGKLARLTLTDSKIGNVLDHGLDQVHPPFWYYAWAPGLGATAGDPLLLVAWLLIGFYIGDRLVLGVARRRLGHALHSTTPLDELARSIIGRRNILMTVMAVAVPAGVGAAGLWICMFWQGLTMLWHGLRTVQLGFASGRTAEKT